MVEESLASQEFQVERKNIRLVLKENARGRFLRITETVGAINNTVIIPDAGLEALAAALGEIIQASRDQPEKNPPVS